MSYWVSLACAHCGSTLHVASHEEGGTYMLGGSDEASLNVTYNYGAHFRDNLNPDGLKWLDGKRAGDVTEALAQAVEALGVEQDADYWKATPGNAGHALNTLLTWARQHPDGVFSVN